jgi:Family of unknown function (DUF5519)
MLETKTNSPLPPGSRLADALRAWPSITTGLGRFGAITYSLAAREVGHVHGNSHTDLPLPKPLRNELVDSGKAQPHHFLPQSGWVTVPIDVEGGVEQALEIFKLNYDLIAKMKGLEWPKEEG